MHRCFPACCWHTQDDPTRHCANESRMQVPSELRPRLDFYLPSVCQINSVDWPQSLLLYKASAVITVDCHQNTINLLLSDFQYTLAIKRSDPSSVRMLYLLITAWVLFFWGSKAIPSVTDQCSSSCCGKEVSKCFPSDAGCFMNKMLMLTCCYLTNIISFHLLLLNN